MWFGAWGIGGWYWGPPRDQESTSAIEAALQSGIRAFDTAPVYGFGHSEELIGQALQGRRHEAFIATKCSLVWDRPGDPFFTTVHGERSVDVRRNLSRSSILQECEESLLRLRTDYIDLYQIHWPLSPLDEAAQALAELKGQGKIRFAGLCNTNVEQIIEWKKLTGFHPDFVQERYSLNQRKIDAGLKPYTLKHSIPILAYSPLAQGLLTGAIRSDRVFGEGDRRGGSTIMDPEYISRIEPALDQARAIASSYNVNLSQLAIAW
ncbi:MAG TPA: aldo/keto reductase, partial [Leptospiraceae bacterium]|nr:aldo/keto reductase [Leptospiraceae bacterium]